MQAEEWGITQANLDAKLAEAKANTNLADLRRFFGVEGDFGRQLGLPRAMLHMVGSIGMLADVGKTRLPRALLDKPGMLNPAAIDNTAHNATTWLCERACIPCSVPSLRSSMQALYGTRQG